MLETKVFKHLIKRNRLKTLDDFHAFADGHLRSLHFQSREKVTLHAAHVNLLETRGFVFPIVVTHSCVSFLWFDGTKVVSSIAAKRNNCYIRHFFPYFCAEKILLWKN